MAIILLLEFNMLYTEPCKTGFNQWTKSIANELSVIENVDYCKLKIKSLEMFP